MVDLVVRGDTVVTPQGVGAYDIAIAGERIVAVAAKGSLPVSDGARLIDAGAKIVMPGGIDPHVHCKWHLPNPDGSAGLTEPPDVVGRAAVHGGTTTMIDFTRASQGADVQDAIAKREEDWKGHCACDYAQHIMVEGALPLTLPEQLAEAIQAGFPTVKIFTTDITPSRKGRMVDFGDIWEVFQVLRANGGLGVIHSEDNDIVMHMYGKLIREGRTGFANMAEVHNTLSEDISFRRVIRLAEKVGATLYMMHTSAASGVSAIREARARGVSIYGESLHQYMLYTSEDYKRTERADLSHLSVAEVSRGPGSAVGRHAGRLHQLRGHRRDLLHAGEEAAGRSDRRHDRRQCRRRAASGADVHRDGRQARLFAEPVCRSGIDQRGEDHGPVSAQGRYRSRIGRRYLRAGSGRQAGDPRGGPARGRLHAMGRPQDGGMAMPDVAARQGGGGERQMAGRADRRQMAASQDRPRNIAPAPYCNDGALR